MLKAIIFDFDGVLADTFKLILGICRERKGNISLKKFRDHHNGNAFESSVIDFTEEDTADFVKKYDKRLERKHLFPLKDRLKQLQRKHQLFIISSSTEKIIGDYFSAIGISGLFRQILGMETHKSKVEKFKIIFKEYKLKSEECIFVTDTLGDLREAKRVKIPTIAVTWGFHGKTRLKKGSPNMIIHDFKELVPAINKLKKYEKNR